MKPGAQVRAAAARIVTAVLAGAALERALEPVITDVAPRDQGLCRELCAGTLRFAPRLEAILALLLARPLRKRDADVHSLALLGLYQLSETRIPAHAAVSATVDAVAILGKRRAAGLLNAVLRRFQREQDELLAQLKPAARDAHPDWLWQALRDHWPQDHARIFEANNRRPPMTLRVNTARGTRDAYRERLASAQLSAHDGILSPAALTLTEAVDVGALPGFAEGLVSVQDEAAQLAALLLAPQSGERILDACAAPGGKTLHMLELAPDVRLTAMDVNAERLQRVTENLQRGNQRAELVAGDAASPPTTVGAASPFDAMLVDVPCTATGVIRRHPDIKVLRRPGDAAGFAVRQGAILDGLWPLLRPGGRLLYVTCSLLPEENSAVVRAFLDRCSDAREQALDVAGARAQTVGVQLLPDPAGCDGLYFALLCKGSQSG